MFYNFNSTFCDRAQKFELKIQNKTIRDTSGRWALLDEYISHHMIQNNNPISAIDYMKALKYLDVEITQSRINNDFNSTREC